MSKKEIKEEEKEKNARDGGLALWCKFCQHITHNPQTGNFCVLYEHHDCGSWGYRPNTISHKCTKAMACVACKKWNYVGESWIEENEEEDGRWIFPYTDLDEGDLLEVV